MKSTSMVAPVPSSSEASEDEDEESSNESSSEGAADAKPKGKKKNRKLNAVFYVGSDGASLNSDDELAYHVEMVERETDP